MRLLIAALLLCMTVSGACDGKRDAGSVAAIDRATAWMTAVSAEDTIRAATFSDGAQPMQGARDLLRENPALARAFLEALARPRIVSHATDSIQLDLHPEHGQYADRGFTLTLVQRGNEWRVAFASLAAHVR